MKTEPIPPLSASADTKPRPVTRSPRRWFPALSLGVAVLGAAVLSARVAQAGEVNLALNRSGTGHPSPLASDRGWGGGSSPWEIVDGQRTYDQWHHGLAFTGGHTDGPGSGGWIEPAGPRQATIDFGAPRTFHKVMLWQHGEVHTPDQAELHYWDGSVWVPIAAQRVYGAMAAGGTGSWSDEYSFTPVTGSKVRWSFDNRGSNIVGTPNIHGWIYEFEVFGQDGGEPGKPDLVLTQRTDVEAAGVGSPFSYTLVLANTGAKAATEVRVSDLLPAAAQTTSTVPSQGIIEQAGNRIAWSVGTLAPNDRVTLTISGQIRCAGSGYHRAQAEAAEAESNLENNAVATVLGATSSVENLALNPSGSGYPSPLESDRGWGGGSYPWEIVDGLRTYDQWDHGLAFTGGHTDGAGTGGWLEPAGPRQATIDLGTPRTFNKVAIWQHGDVHTPDQAELHYWDGSAWLPIAAQRVYGAMAAGGTGSWSDEYTFAPVTGSKVRWSFDNRDNNIVGSPNVHGWIYEFEVFGASVCSGVSLAARRVVVVEVHGQIGGRYRIEYTPALADPPVWNPITEVTLTSERHLVVDPSSSDEGARFYRAVELP